jgi:hypothetical protein
LKILQASKGQAARKIQETAAAQDLQEQPVRSVLFTIFLIERPCNIMQHSTQTKSSHSLSLSPMPVSLFIYVKIKKDENVSNKVVSTIVQLNATF